MPRAEAPIPRAVTLYQAALWRKTRLLARVNALFDGFWLGVLSRDDWGRFDQLHFDQVKEPVGGSGFRYDQDEWNQSGLHDWEAAAVERHFAPGARVVVTGAGGGREVLALLERGFDAIGYEPHAGLVAAGAALLERLGHPERLFVSERDAFPPAAGRCDAVLVGWGSYTLIAGRSRRIEFLRAARARLAPGGPILLSFFTHRSPGDARQLALVSRVANAIRRASRGEPVEVGDALRPNLVHYFTREQIASELEAAGFELEHYAQRPYGHAVGRAA